MRYDYTCKKCGWKGERRVSLADRDNLKCENSVPVAGFAVAGVVGDDGRIKEFTSASIVPLGVQSDPNTVLRGPCDGELVREEISLTAKMGHRWMP